MQLLQRCQGTEIIIRDVKFPLSLLPCPAVILVASAGLGIDHIAGMELLNSAKSAGGLAVAILLKPFSFEGQRRLEEVNDLVNKLQECSHLFIVVEADSLLNEEMETLAEASDSLNNAVFLAMHTISILMSEVHLKILNTPDGQMKEVGSFEILHLLETYGEAKVGFGAGYNLKSAIMHAAFHCPSLCSELKGFNGVVLFTLTSSCDMDESDFRSAILSFRRYTECTGDIIFSRICEPNLEPNHIVAALLLLGYEGKKVAHKKSFLSGLALHFPFMFSFFQKKNSQPNDNPSAYSHSKPYVDSIFASDNNMSLHLANSLEAKIEDKKSAHSSRESNHNNKIVGGDSSEISCKSEKTCQTNGDSGVLSGHDSNFSVGPGFHIAQLWAKERAGFVGSNQIDMLKIFTLPVGVKSSTEVFSNGVVYSESTLPDTSNNLSTDSLHTEDSPYRDASPDTGLEAITEIYNNAFTLLKGRHVDEPRKRGLLSERAASMLESERESPKSWTPILEMPYRGGIYRGRCEGGLPEGKGCLTFSDGSFYDGMWHYGKRSGLGTLCYSNGDVFQGAWRDDLMHGRGWFYFHSGDRWFANFWKGKANGEGRFYSNDGSIFFGHFQNGWRHGEGLRIDVNGSRWTEIWEEGMLVSKTLLENRDER